MNPTLTENHYVSVPGFIDAQRAQELAQEFLELERQGLCSKDAQAPNSSAAYNFLPFVRLMVEKIPLVSELCGEPVLPTYAYARIYKPGESLGRHRDRDACEISLTLNLAQDTRWPIHIQKPDGQEVALDLKPGDAMMYLGCEADHWRERYTGQRHVQLFIHYVRAHGPRAYTFFNIAREPASTRPQHAQTVMRTDTARETKGPTASTPERIAEPVARSEHKVGRNEPCPCGSGKKYKHCHAKGAAPGLASPLLATPNAARPAPERNIQPPVAPGKPDLQFQALVRARHAGNPQAITALGARLIVGRDSPVAPIDGAMLLAEAAEQGDAEAWAYLAVLAGAGVGRAQSWSDAFDAIERAAGLGHEHATRQVQLLRGQGLLGVRDIEDWLAEASGRVLREAPHMVAYSGFLTSELCSHLMTIAAPRRIQAQVHDVHRGALKVDPMRTNTGAAFSLIDTDLIMQLVRARIARAAGVAPAALEPLEILHYAVGQTYKPHVDFFHPGIPQFAEQMRVKGQRVKTCLIYLNEDLEGGETEFPKLGVKFRGREGEALIFSNVTADGAGDMNTLHAGLPPTRGEK